MADDSEIRLRDRFRVYIDLIGLPRSDVTISLPSWMFNALMNTH